MCCAGYAPHNRTHCWFCCQTIAKGQVRFCVRRRESAKKYITTKSKWFHRHCLEQFNLQGIRFQLGPFAPASVYDVIGWEQLSRKDLRWLRGVLQGSGAVVHDNDDSKKFVYQSLRRRRKRKQSDPPYTLRAVKLLSPKEKFVKACYRYTWTVRRRFLMEIAEPSVGEAPPPGPGPTSASKKARVKYLGVRTFSDLVTEFLKLNPDIASALPQLEYIVGHVFEMGVAERFAEFHNSHAKLCVM